MQTVAVYVIVFVALATTVFYFVRRLRRLGGGGRKEEGCEGCPLKDGCCKVEKKTSASKGGCGCSDGCGSGSK